MRRRLQLSLRTKLRLGFAVVLLVSFVVYAFGYRTASLNTAAGDRVEHTYTVIQQANEALLTFDDVQVRYEQFLRTASAQARAAYDVDLQYLHSQLKGLAALTADNPPQIERWNALAAQVDVLSDTSLVPVMRVREQLAQGSVTETDLANAEQASGAQQNFLVVRDSFATAIGVERSLLAQRTLTVDEEDARLEQVLVGGFIATVALGLLSTSLLSRSIARAMERFAEVAQAIAHGDLRRRVALVRTDEIGRAADAFDAMAQALEHDIDERIRVQASTESLLNAAAEGIYGIDARGRVRIMNPAAERLTGFSFDETQGQRLHTLLHHTRADGTPYPAEECPTRKALVSGQIGHIHNEVFWRKDGTSFPVEYTAVPIKTNGVMTGAVMTFHDISQQLAVDRMKDEFISVVSHELKTPLSSIRGSLGLLAAGVLGPVPERANRMVEVALNNTDRLIRLVTDILDIERIESGRMPMQFSNDDAQELVQRSIESITPVATSAGVDLICRAESIPVYVDSDRIVQTLTNLLSNAIKFSDAGSKVIVEVRRDDDMALFSVQDSGRGIPIDKQELIFRRFEQVEMSDSRQKGGTGLGLPIARSIVRQHGGNIWVDSTPGKGSTFYFTLPRLSGGLSASPDAAGERRSPSTRAR